MSLSFHQRSLHIRVSYLTLLLSEGQVDKAWEPLNKATLFRIYDSIG